MRKIFCFALTVIAIFSITACSSSDDDEPVAKVTPLPSMETISLNYRPSTQNVTLARNVQDEGATVSLKKGVSWINNLSLSGKNISFEVEENTMTTDGHRYDTIIVAVRGQRIGSICVTQAKSPFSTTELKWATSNAMYQSLPISDKSLSGLEMTKLIYNLEKATGGKDTYKNYPAFAFCIEMNHDPEHHMEWYLPSEEEMRTYVHAQSWANSPFAKQKYWWTSSENYLNGNAYNIYTNTVASRGAVAKGGSYWVAAFRNGKLEE